ncbi:MAG: RDD family protein [Pseudomonadota bacterium]
MTMSDTYPGLPDPERASEFYDGVPTKRLVAWIVDVVIIGILTALIVPFTAFTALLFLPFLYMVISFLYRWVTLARGSATWGMRFMSIELRNRMGERFDGGTAALHTLGYMLSVAIFPAQLVSVALMLISSRRQGLTDHFLGTAAVNKAAM